MRPEELFLPPEELTDELPDEFLDELLEAETLSPVVRSRRF